MAAKLHMFANNIFLLYHSPNWLRLLTNTCKSYFCRVLARLNSKIFIDRVDKHVVDVVSLS